MVTKEQALKENYELKASIQSWSNKDATRRKQFAKVLNRTDNRFGMHETPQDLSWEEIFCEVGKLIAFQDFRQWKDGIEMRMDVIQSGNKSSDES